MQPDSENHIPVTERLRHEFGNTVKIRKNNNSCLCTCVVISVHLLVDTIPSDSAVIRFVKIHLQRRKNEKKTKLKIDSKSRVAYSFKFRSLVAYSFFFWSPIARTCLQSETSTKTSPNFSSTTTTKTILAATKIDDNIILFQLLLYRRTVSVYHKPFTKVEWTAFDTGNGRHRHNGAMMILTVRIAVKILFSRRRARDGGLDAV